MLCSYRGLYDLRARMGLTMTRTCYRNILIEVFVRSAEYVEHSDVTLLSRESNIKQIQ